MRETVEPKRPPTLSFSGSSWPAASVSVIFAVATTHLFLVYSRLHWGVLFSRDHGQMDEAARSQLFVILGRLEWYRVGGLLALFFAVWALQFRPRWPGWIALSASLLAVVAAMLIM